MNAGFRCRSCDAGSWDEFVDLGEMPSANAFLEPGQEASERPFPLRAVVCEECRLVQLDTTVDPAELFTDYAYFSSFSSSWLEHARRFTAQVSERFQLDEESFVLEVASNDGYLLKNFVAAGVPVLGIEPAANVAEAAVAAGVQTRVDFFGEEVALDVVAERGQADLVIGNNVLAHVPAINDFVAGFQRVLAPEGVLCLEFPHLLRLLAEVQFDTIYHEHFFYLSLIAVEAAFARHGLRLFDVEELPTHGGSLRVYACHAGAAHESTPGLAAVRDAERAGGLHEAGTYRGFQERVDNCRASLLAFLARCREEGAAIAGYGAAAKGNTLLNYCGVTSTDVPFLVDKNPRKQGRLAPGSRIPVRAPAEVLREKPDYLLILPWNLREEVMEQMAEVRSWGGRFVTAVPEVQVFE